MVEGEIGPGAFYALFAPDNWNGDLLVWAHGWVDPAAPITIEGAMPTSLRDEILSLGFGVAYSSYSENGYAVKKAVVSTRQLRGIFAENFGEPENTYLMGNSLGGIILMTLAETNPQLYAGALPMCSLLGGSQMEFEYILNTRILFDYFYPDVIPGDAMHIPEDLDFNAQVVPAVVGAILANPAAAVRLAGVDQVEIAYSNFGELINSIVVALYFNIRGVPNVQDRTRPFFDNMNTIYTGSGNDDELNKFVDRFAASPAGTNYLQHWYQTDGDLELPVLTLHTTMDPAVPWFHEPAYADLVSQAGKQNMLVQREFDRYGHCAFTTDEMLNAFLDLVSWAETGVAPLP